MSGGFRPQRTLYKLTKFDTPDLDGLEVTVKSVSIDTLLKLLGVAGDLEDLDESSFSPADLEKFTGMLKVFGRMLHSWNVEDDDGQPVPATYEGLADQDMGFVIPVISQVAETIAQAPRPLPDGSPSGKSSPEVPPAVVSGSRSRPSSPAPS